MTDPFVERAQETDDGRFDHLFQLFAERMADTYADKPLTHADLQQLFSLHLYFAGGAPVHLLPDQIDVAQVETQFKGMLNQDSVTLRLDCDIALGRCSSEVVIRRSTELRKLALNRLAGN